MFKKIIGITVLISAFLFVGCTAMTRPHIEDHTFTKAPNVSEYEQAIKEAAGGSLKDPYSARYKFGTPAKGYWQRGLKDWWVGWVIPFEINAKNSYGGYTGYTPYRAAVESGKVVEVRDVSETEWIHLFE